MRKYKLPAADWVNATNGAASFNSPAVDVSEVRGFAVHAKTSAASTLVGTLKLQGRVLTGDAAWTDVTDSSQNVASGEENHFWNYDGSYYSEIRLVWTFTSGTGTIDAAFLGKNA